MDSSLMSYNITNNNRENTPNSLDNIIDIVLYSKFISLRIIHREDLFYKRKKLKLYPLLKQSHLFKLNYNVYG